MTIDADIRGAGVPLVHVHVDGEGTTDEAAELIGRMFTVRECTEDISGVCFCDTCGSVVVYGWKFCPKCGQRMEL